MRYLYAVADSPAPLPAVEGIAGTAVEPVRYAELCVLTGDVPPDAVARPAGEALWAHEDVVEAVAREADAVLPMRFGSTVRDVPRAVALLSARHDELVRGLDRVRGRAELGVRVVAQPPWDGPLPGGGRDGTAWLRGRRDARDRAERVADLVHAPLAGLADESRRAPLVAGTTVLAASYLVPQHALEQFRDEAARLDRALDDAAVVCTGPWPPYGFTPGEGAWEGTDPRGDVVAT